MRAIDTRYKGYLFRSRLEARWAIFFDAMGLQWDYEPEGFKLGDAGWYLPDFFIQMPALRDKYPDAGYWVEIKGVAPTEDELNKLQRLAQDTGHHAYLFVGDPLNLKGDIYRADYAKGNCKRQSMRAYAACFFCCSPPVGESYMDKYMEAATAARSARFEFGEQNIYDAFDAISKTLGEA